MKYKTACIKADTYTEFKKLCDNKGVPVARYLDRMIKKEIEREEKKKGGNQC